MDCKHERLRTVKHRVFCAECGEELPLEFLLGRGKEEKKKAPARKKPKSDRE